MPNIDSLSIKVTADTQTATNGLKQLASSLEKLKSAVSGIRGLEGNLEGVSNGVKGIADALTPLSNIKDLSKNLSSISRLPTTMEKLGKADISGFATSMQNIADAMQPLAEQCEKCGPALQSMALVMQTKYAKGMQEGADGTKKLSSELTKAYYKARLFIGIAQRVINLFNSAVSQSMAYEETLNLFRVAMGEYYDQSYEYANSVQQGMGIDAAEWMKYEAVFMNMAKGFGIVSDKAETMARNLTQMGYDLASVFNVDFDTAMEKLESAISGQPRPMREWGFDLSEANMKMVALNHGVQENVENMTQAQKAILRYIYLFENMENLGLSGDFARTIETPANALRVAQANLTLAGRALGNIFIPLVNDLLPKVTAMAKAVAEIANSLSAITGYSVTELDYSSLEESVTGVDEELTDATESAKALKSAIMGFDELNVISANSSGTDLTTVLSDVISSIDLPDNTTWLQDGLTEKIDALIPRMKETLALLGSIAAVLTTIFVVTKVTSSIGEIKETLSKINPQLLQTGKYVLGISAAVTGMVAAKNAASDLADALSSDNEGLGGAIIELVGGVGTSAAGGAMVGGWIGALVAGFLALGTAILEFTADYGTAQHILRMEELYEGAEAFSEAKASIEEYFDSLDFDKAEQWNTQLKNAGNIAENTADSYELLLTKLSTKGTWSTEEIDELTASFDNLVESLNNLRDIKIDSLLSAIQTAIKLNITPELSDRFSDLTANIVALQGALETKTDDTKKEYYDVLADIAKNGATPEKVESLKSIVSELKKYEISGDSEYYKWKGESSIIASNINAGTTFEELQANVDSLKASYDGYASNITAQYEQNKATLEALIKLDKEEFGGMFGLGDQDLTDLETAFNYEIGLLQDEYNAMLETMANSYLKAFSASTTDTNGIRAFLNAVTGGVFFKEEGAYDYINKYMQGEALGDKSLNIKVYIDGKEVAAAVTEEQQTSGATVSGSGNIIYGGLPSPVGLYK